MSLWFHTLSVHLQSFVVTTNDGSAVPFTLQYTPGGSKRYVVAAATNGVRVAGGPTTVCYTGTPRNTGGTGAGVWLAMEANVASGVLLAQTRQE